MNKYIFGLTCLAVFFRFGISEAEAANWIMLQGTEPPQAPALRAFGLIGVDYQRTSDSPLPAGPWKGRPSVLNQIGPELEEPEELQVSLLRLGVRGRLAEGRVNYWVSPLAGSNGISKNGTPNVKFTDVSATLNLIPHARIRVGQFKQPGPKKGCSPRGCAIM